MRSCLTVGLVGLVLATLTIAPALATPVPTADVDGGHDSPIVSRFKGSVIIGYQNQDYAELTLPLGPYDEGGFQKSRKVEGRLSRIAYAVPAGKSALEVFRNYEQALQAAGFAVAYQCDRNSCGGFDFASQVVDPLLDEMSGERNVMIDTLMATNGNVSALTAHLDRPQGAVDLTVLVSQDGNRQAGVLLQIAEGKAMQGGQVAVDAKAMSEGLATAGHVALYGIRFANDSAELDRSSDETLQQMTALLQQQPDLKVYIVGHTDNTGVIDHNMSLSQQRADAVVDVLEKAGISAARLAAKGIGPYAPVASNDTDDGRARNRRVELVKQ
ncbi:OmpA family protein [Rhizobium halophytocola]|uniref:Outer membrane protein OmpA-like peptidoglycan-associated protein n=1 Tax=Rhizobium halophytocola TaxID=735519 RepID=A0ABS4E3N6_9HYPH|nr:OmpA family protein [Rhizobium halophytocola]MBP1852549.1 outer membrane protein OmpA-like peptidoglycan-associated protein [Rhizobium halophytocola]